MQEPGARVEALLDLALAMDGAGEFARSQEILGQLQAEARERGDRITELRARIPYLVYNVGEPGFRRETLRSELRAIIDELGPDEPARDLSAAWLGVGMLEAGNGEVEREAFERSLELSTRAGDLRHASAAVANLATSLQDGSVPVDDALARIESYADRGVGGRRAEAALKSTRAGLLSMIGRLDEARGLIGEAIEICQQMRAVWWEVYIRGEQAGVELAAGNPEAAAAALQPCDELIAETSPMRRWHLGDRVPVLAATGRYPEAIAIADQLLADSEDDFELAMKALVGKAAAHHGLGELETARSTIDKAIKRLADAALLPDLGYALLERAKIRHDAGDDAWTSDLTRARDAFAAKGHLVGLQRVDAYALEGAAKG